jgi:hypothetical protein
VDEVRAMRGLTPLSVVRQQAAREQTLMQGGGGAETEGLGSA